jgi:hypothetical protein
MEHPEWSLCIALIGLREQYFMLPLMSRTIVTFVSDTVVTCLLPACLTVAGKLTGLQIDHSPSRGFVCFCFCFEVLGFDLRASHLLGRGLYHSSHTT